MKTNLKISSKKYSVTNTHTRYKILRRTVLNAKHSNRRPQKVQRT